MNNRARQRGAFVPGPWGIVFYAILAGVIAAAAFWAWQHFVANPYRDEGRSEVREKWLALIEKCEGARGTGQSCRNDWDAAQTQRQEALDANKRLREVDIPNLKTQVDACNRGVDQLAEAKKTSDAEKVRALNVAKTALDALASDTKMTKARAAAPAIGTCTEIVAKQVAGLTELAERELRDRPPLDLTVELIEPKSTPPIATPQAKPGRAPDPRLDRLKVQ